MKGLPPSLRKRKRYIAFHLIAENRVGKVELSRALLDELLALFGEWGADEVWLEHFDGEVGIVGCYHASLEKVKVAITLMSRVGEVKVNPVILGVSGTIKRCKKKYLEVLKGASSPDGL